MQVPADPRDVARRSAVTVPMMPMLRYTLVAWGIFFTGIAGLVTVTSIGSDDGGAAASALFVALGVWMTWRWWAMGAVVTRDAVVMRGAFSSRRFPRTGGLLVECRPRARSWRRGLLMGDWAGYEVVVSTQNVTRGLGRIGMTFQSVESGGAFAERVNEAMAADDV